MGAFSGGGADEIFWEARSEADPNRWITVDIEGNWHADAVTTDQFDRYLPSADGDWTGHYQEPIELAFSYYYRPKSRHDHLALGQLVAMLLPEPVNYSGYPPPLPPVPPGCVVIEEELLRYHEADDKHRKVHRAWLRRKRLAIKRRQEATIPSQPEETAMESTDYLPAEDLGAYLARHRPPGIQSIELPINPQGPGGLTRFGDAMRAVLHAVVSDWPSGVVFVVAFDEDSRYVQGMYYPTSWLIEFGKQPPAVMRAAMSDGWIDPDSIPDNHTDFKSRREWQNNLVQELDWHVDGLPTIAGALEKAAYEHLGARPDDPYFLQIFRTDDGGDDDEDVLVAPVDEVDVKEKVRA
ncbi:hypothetical protein HT102_09545 [Hoyosella sp. G463]|uniref:Uncharacterized protein n=1 Tax=Lolliginicoccus lacisalsi TaxID=2742202 RepID=A0A927JCK1_9ACTN|nr:hypothetical protein [Lolliginicoccus lacisalsi]MBD8506729.1 hypothetical protein [Lolliginicoccus lacisalsi]